MTILSMADKKGKPIKRFAIVLYLERTYVCLDVEKDLYSSQKREVRIDGIRLLLIKDSPKHKYEGALSLCPPANEIVVLEGDGLDFLLTHPDLYFRKIAKQYYSQTLEGVTNNV